MTEVEKLYENFCTEVSDINEHLHILKKYASECSHVTEMGVRYGVSTCALMCGNPEKLISYDITEKHLRIKDVLYNDSKLLNVDFNFIISDSLKIKIENTDLLFIDTYHSYNQLYNELSLHSDCVNKYIILHDTTTFGYSDEHFYEEVSEFVKNLNVHKQGLFNAVLDFLKSKPGLDWEIHERYENNNGLTILKKIIK